MTTKPKTSDDYVSSTNNGIALLDKKSHGTVTVSNDVEPNNIDDRPKSTEGEESEPERSPLMAAQSIAENDEEKTCSCWKSKYSWRHLLPFSCCCKSSKLTNLENAGFLEFFTISWASDVITAGFKKALKASDLGRLSESEKACFNYNKFIRCYEEEREKRKSDDVPIGRIIFKIIRTKYIFAVIFLLASLLLQLFTAGVILKRLLSFIEKPSGSAWTGIKLVLLLIVAQFCLSLLSSGLFMLMIRAGAAARAAVLSIIYNKLTRLKNSGEKSVGELVNLCANDAQRVFECCQFGAFLVGAPFLVIIVCVYLYVMFGPSSLIGVVVMILFLPIQVLLGKVISKIRAKVILITDKRVKMISEVLTCIKLIKMYAWEKSFLKEILELRSKEKKHLAGILYVQAINMSMGTLLTVAAPVATFAAHIAFGNNITVAEPVWTGLESPRLLQAFTVIVMFNIFPRNIVLLPMAVRGLSEATNAMKRLRNLLKLEEYIPHADEPEDQDITLEMQQCHFSWPSQAAETSSEDSNQASKQSKNLVVKFKPEKTDENNVKTIEDADKLYSSLSPTLFDINLNVKKGSLIGICGGVGSGKSSLLQAILAQMHCTSGKVKVTKSIAYVSQQAWIIHDTIRNNITLRKDYREKEYKKACEACCLNADLDSFENGDLTEIGERGLNLSGGQKQRVSLARALYADADLYLLDDPLSAVDAHVGQHIFQHCIKEQLQHKTVLFVTHQLQYLRNCDEIICLSNGKIEEHGTFTNLLDTGREFSRLIRKFLEEHENEKKHLKEIIDKADDKDKITRNFDDAIRLRARTNSNTPSIESGFQIDVDIDRDDEADEEARKIEKGKIVKEEESSTGSVSWSIYKSFCKSGGGYIAALAAVLSQLSVLAAVFFVEWWLSEWLKTASKTVYIGNSTVPEKVSLANNPNISFFMSVYISTGCSMFFLQLISSMFFVGFFITAATNLHKGALNSVLKCPMKFFDTNPTGRILNRFSRDQDELDGRLPFVCESFAKHGGRIFISLIFISVIFPWFLVALVPLSILFVILNKIFRRSNRELKRIENVTRSPMFSHVTATVQGLTTLHAYGKTDDFRKQFFNYVDLNTSPMFLYYTSNQWLRVRLDILCIAVTTVTAIIAIFTKGSVPAAFAGLAITYSMRMTGLFQFVCRLAAEAEARFTSAERMTNYAYNLEAEDQNPDHESPSENWPDGGMITFENVQLRYRPELPLVLKEVTFSVNSKEKIGIAGRTGAGKSSLAVALLRLAELNDGRILIDDVDISKIDVQYLRSKLSVIPQDPVLFIGTLRHNLDPFGRCTDEELWSALEKSHMNNTIANLPLKLETPVIENGENFSVGERQLICMGRALLRGSKILLMDEATAAIDTETDAKIQDTIRDSFKDCTVLTIAHRLNTILESDKIIVMDDGKVAEFDTPSNLMSNPDSQFAKMRQKSVIVKK